MKEIFENVTKKLGEEFPDLTVSCTGTKIYVRGAFPVLHGGKVLDRYQIEIGWSDSDANTALTGRRAEVECGCLEPVDVHRVAQDGEVALLLRQRWSKPFWEQTLWRWDAMFIVGVRAHYQASQLAAPAMIAQRRGLIVNISFWAAQKHVGNVVYGVSKAATDKMTADMATELKPYGVAVVSLYPGLLRTVGGGYASNVVVSLVGADREDRPHCGPTAIP